MADMQLCAACGVVRAPGKSHCAHCKAEHGPGALVVPRPDDRFWVCIECTFRCRMCGFVVPLNHLDMDGGVSCARCGLEQAFEVRGWVDALRHAHAVGELFGERAEGIDDAMEEVGVRRTSLALDVGGGNAFRTTSSPGHPLCESCHAPVDVAPEGDGRVAVSCKACGASAAYVVPAAARKMTKGALEAVIATEHRADRAPVKVDQTPGAVAVRCPSCNASLPASEASKFLTCGYCNTVSRIPDHTWFQMSGKDPVSESMWLLFRGESRLHQDAVREGERESRAAREKAERAAARAAKQEEEAAARLRGRRENDEREKRDERESAERARKKEAEDRRYTTVGGVVIAVVLTAIVMISVGVSVASRAAPTASPAASTVATKPRSKPPPKPPPAYVRIPSCKCLARDGSTKNTFTLEAPAAGKDLWYFDWSQQTGFMTSQMPFALRPGDAIVPPPAGTTKLRLAIACDGPIVTLVGAKQATAWAGDDRTVVWNVTLPAAITLPEDPAVLAPTEGTDFDVSCPSQLSVEDGKVALTLANGKHVALAMKDGKLR